jgi:hypothetical protein
MFSNVQEGYPFDHQKNRSVFHMKHRDRICEGQCRYLPHCIVSSGTSQPGGCRDCFTFTISFVERGLLYPFVVMIGRASSSPHTEYHIGSNDYKREVSIRMALMVVMMLRVMGLRKSSRTLISLATTFFPARRYAARQVFVWRVMSHPHKHLASEVKK